MDGTGRFTHSTIPVHTPGMSRPLMRGEILADGHFNGWEKGTLTERPIEPKTLQLVLDRIFHFSETQLDSARGKGSVQFLQHVCGSDIHACNRLCRDNQPVHGRG